jgi:hypothetical protein
MADLHRGNRIEMISAANPTKPNFLCWMWIRTCRGRAAKTCCANTPQNAVVLDEDSNNHACFGNLSNYAKQFLRLLKLSRILLP